MSITKIIGTLLIIAGILGGLYLGLWVCVIGGIVQIVEAFKATPVEAMGIALGLVRVWAASLVGGATFWICTFFGSCFLAATPARGSTYGGHRLR